ncbi:MAG: hypothetical protein ABIJ09_00645 [Pseudomonadota bacterium]
MTSKHDGSKQPEPRLPYEAPRLSKVKLRPEEAVLGGCKTASAAGPAQPTCAFPDACITSGS